MSLLQDHHRPGGSVFEDDRLGARAFILVADADGLADEGAWEASDKKGIAR